MIFDKFNLNGLALSNRIVMAPMTRTRSRNGIMTDINVAYYRQRASVGLIITEGTSISASSMGYLNVPGLYNAAQTQSWRKVTDAVHAEGGKIFTQLWHVGRVSHVSNQPNNFDPVAPSAIQAKNSTAWGIEEGKEGRIQVSTPRALEEAEIGEIIQDYVKAARNAMEAGFDGIEIHAANGYLVDQFLNPSTNLRTDAFGGSMENRIRFALDVVDAIASEIGSGKVGIRFSPYGTQHDMALFEEIEETFQLLGEELSTRGLAYVHLHDQGSLYAEHFDFLEKFRRWYKGTVMFAGFLTKERAIELTESGLIDLAAFGRPLISNPDLVKRLESDLPLAESKRDYYYGNTPIGYNDYPTYEMEVVK